MYVCAELNHFAVHLKLTQHCKSIIFQFLKVGGKKNQNTQNGSVTEKTHRSMGQKREPRNNGLLVYNK